MVHPELSLVPPVPDGEGAGRFGGDVRCGRDDEGLRVPGGRARDACARQSHLVLADGKPAAHAV